MGVQLGHRGRGDGVADGWDVTEPTACPGAGATRARLRQAPRVIVARPGGHERQLLETALERDGFATVSAEDGVGALETICAVGPDVIVADLDLMPLDGLGLCRVIRTLRAHADLPVLVLTGAGPPNHARVLMMRRIGRVQVMQKPVDGAFVAAAVSAILGIVPVALPVAAPHRRSARAVEAVGGRR